jgi:hypothetical protein
MEIKNNLEIRKANINHIENIASIEKFLWNEPIENRIEKLKWKSKSLNNTIFGAVAFLKDELVGYRGIMFSKIKLNGQEFKLLHFTDAVVHEKARGMSLLKKMNEFILNEYKSDFDFSYIYFPNHVSGHIYRSQGHKDFHYIDFFRRCVVNPLAFTDVKYLVLSEPSQINQVLSNNNVNKVTFQVMIDEDFITWKLREPNKNYIFCISEKDKNIFTWLELKKNSVEIQMLNYDKLNECLNLAKSVARKNKKLVVNIPVLEFQDKKLHKVFKENGFYKWKILNKIRANTFSKRAILSKKLNDQLSSESIKIFNDQTLWEYHNITFV